MKTFKLLVLAGVLLATTLGTSAVASAASVPEIQYGTGWFADANSVPLSGCTISAVGHDDSGRSVAITAGHCVAKLAVGAPVYVAGTVVGSYSGVSNVNGVDFAVLLLDKATPKSGGALGDMTGVADSTAFEQASKVGATTGVTPGVILSQDSMIHALVPSFSGDSGGPLMASGKWLGEVHGFDLSGFTYTPATAIVAALGSTSPGTVGHGFTIA